MRARLDRLPPNHPSSPAYRRAAEARARDTPRQADQSPERQRPWYAEHATREHAIERQRRDQEPGTGFRRWRDNWYWQQHGEMPAPFRADVAARVPDTSPRTKGRLDRHDGGDGLPLESGSRTGLVDALAQQTGRLPEGYTIKNQTHVEAHAAADQYPHAVVIYPGDHYPEEGHGQGNQWIPADPGDGPLPELCLTVGTGQSPVFWDEPGQPELLSQGTAQDAEPELEFFYGGQESYAPAWSLIPAEQAREAARQFIVSDGKRPANITWRTAQPT